MQICQMRQDTDFRRNFHALPNSSFVIILTLYAL
jgi:hypothetical protein